MNFAQPRVSGVPAAAKFPAVPADRSPHRIATNILLLYLFLMVGRGMEMLSMKIGVNLRVTLILTVVLAVAAVLAGDLVGALRTPVVAMFTLFTGWFLITTLTSQWRGGSVMTLTTYWLPSYACILLVPSLISSVDQCRKACYALAFSLVPILLATVIFQSQIMGRDQADFGTLGNPNDLAFALLLLIPFAVFVIVSESMRNWKAILCVFAIAFALFRTLRTGSRSGALTTAICFIILLVSVKLKGKLKLLGIAGVILVSAPVFVPSDLLLRYATIFNGTSVDANMSNDEVSAVESAQARKMLFQESVRIMLENPLFGVGPGIFSAQLAKEQRQRGEAQSWHEAHNSYTQIGSEMGFPGFLIYLAILIYGMKRAVSIYRRTRNDPSAIVICRMAASFSMALVIFAVCATFGTYSYSFQFPILASLVQAFDVCVRREMNTAPSIAPARFPPRSVAPTPNPQVSTNVRHRRLRHDRA